tara:strand:+ start:353 stop:739 length:387 start_codon:yes stop_codon:yes gene_type:complete
MLLHLRCLELLVEIHPSNLTLQKQVLLLPLVVVGVVLLVNNLILGVQALMVDLVVLVEVVPVALVLMHQTILVVLVMQEVFQHLQEKDMMVEMVQHQEIEQVAVVAVPVVLEQTVDLMLDLVESEFSA